MDSKNEQAPKKRETKEMKDDATSVQTTEKSGRRKPATDVDLTAQDVESDSGGDSPVVRMVGGGCEKAKEKNQATTTKYEDGHEDPRVERHVGERRLGTKKVATSRPTTGEKTLGDVTARRADKKEGTLVAPQKKANRRQGSVDKPNNVASVEADRPRERPSNKDPASSSVRSLDLEKANAVIVKLTAELHCCQAEANELRQQLDQLEQQYLETPQSNMEEQISALTAELAMEKSENARLMEERARDSTRATPPPAADTPFAQLYSHMGSLSEQDDEIYKLKGELTIALGRANDSQHDHDRAEHAEQQVQQLLTKVRELEDANRQPDVPLSSFPRHRRRNTWSLSSSTRPRRVERHQSPDQRSGDPPSPSTTTSDDASTPLSTDSDETAQSSSSGSTTSAPDLNRHPSLTFENPSALQASSEPIFDHSELIKAKARHKQNSVDCGLARFQLYQVVQTFWNGGWFEGGVIICIQRTHDVLKSKREELDNNHINGLPCITRASYKGESELRASERYSYLIYWKASHERGWYVEDDRDGQTYVRASLQE